MLKFAVSARVKRYRVPLSNEIEVSSSETELYLPLSVPFVKESISSKPRLAWAKLLLRQTNTLKKSSAENDDKFEHLVLISIPFPFSYVEGGRIVPHLLTHTSCDRRLSCNKILSTRIR